MFPRRRKRRLPKHPAGAVSGVITPPAGDRPGAVPVRRPKLARGRYSIMGAMIRAKLFRARFRRLFTVPRLQPVISAISS